MLQLSKEIVWPTSFYIKGWRKNMDYLLRDNLFTHMKAWVKEAGSIIRNQMDQRQIINEKTNENDLVTEMDKKIERYFIDQIKTNYPTHQIVSEEGYGDKNIDPTGYVWFVDPIDGTLNYIHQRRNFAISIALYFEGIGEIGIVYDVAENVLYSALKGKGAFKNQHRLPSLSKEKRLDQSMISLNHFWALESRSFHSEKIVQLIRHVRACRTFGSAALEFAYVAEGAIDAYLKKRLEPWDIAAGLMLVNEVGGKTTTLFGEAVNVFRTDSILTSNPTIHAVIIEDYLLKAKK